MNDLIIEWSPNVKAISIGPIAIHWYSLMFLLAFYIGFKIMKKIYGIFKEYKYKLLLIYFFMLLTELSIIIQPYLLGKSIDGLISGGWFWVGLLFCSYSISNLFNYKRMVYDTKVYTQIYNDIVLRFLK